jgi:hypothetical protein
MEETTMNADHWTKGNQALGRAIKQVTAKGHRANKYYPTREIFMREAMRDAELIHEALRYYFQGQFHHVVEEMEEDEAAGGHDHVDVAHS